MKYCIILLACLLLMHTGQGQSIELDTTGKVTKLSHTGNLKPGDNITIQLSSPGFAASFKRQVIDSCKSRLKKKLDSVIVHLDDTRPLSYLNFYNTLWGDVPVSEVLADLKSIRNYLEFGNLSTPLVHLQSFHDKLNKFINAPVKDWFTINNTTLNSNVYTIQAGDKLDDEKAYQIEVRVNLLYHKLITDLFTETYINAADMNGIRSLMPAAYVGESRQLADILQRAKVLSAFHPNNIHDSAKTAMTQLRQEYNGLVVVQGIKTGSFFKNWIWWREGELTLNPFEQRYRDMHATNDGSIIPAFKNTSTLDSLTLRDKNLNRILLAQLRDSFRIISFLQQKGKKGDDVLPLSEPLKSTEDVQVVVHNVNANETADLRLVKSVPHNGMNNTLNMLDSAVSTLGTSLTSLTTVTTAWKELQTILGINKSLPDRIPNEFKLTKALVPNLKKEDTFWITLAADLKSTGTFNPFILNKTKNDAAVVAANLRGKIALRNQGQITNAIITIIDRYFFYYEFYTNEINAFKKDSLVISNIYRLVVESNLPPTSLSIHGDNGTFGYRTEFLFTGPTDANAIQYYEAKRFRKTADKIDSSLIASFKYKTAQKQRFGVSIGPAFTLFASKYYAKNTVTEPANEPIKIATTRDLVNFTFGLHIYPWKIFTLDNNAFHSKASPAYERLSVYVGLGFPKTLENFYPGISFDVIAGIKVIGGVHCYLHDRYKIVNNVVEDKTSRFRDAGGFISINIDPRIAVKAVGLIK